MTQPEACKVMEEILKKPGGKEAALMALQEYRMECLKEPDLIKRASLQLVAAAMESLLLQDLPITGDSILDLCVKGLLSV